MFLYAETKKGCSKFELGRVSASREAGEKLRASEMLTALTQHAMGDWDKAQRETNEAALLRGDGIVSLFRTKEGVRFRIITDASRKTTKVLLAEHDK